jgi:hypothetical protein
VRYRVIAKSVLKPSRHQRDDQSDQDPDVLAVLKAACGMLIDVFTINSATSRRSSGNSPYATETVARGKPDI